MAISRRSFVRSPACPSHLARGAQRISLLVLFMGSAGVALQGSGCATETGVAQRESARVIPKSAEVVDQGHRHLVCVAPDGGTAYVLDVEDHAVLLIPAQVLQGVLRTLEQCHADLSDASQEHTDAQAHAQRDQLIHECIQIYKEMCHT